MSFFNLRTVHSTPVKPMLSSHSAIAVLVMLTAAISIPAHAYDVGDTVDPTVLKTLDVDPNKITLVDFFASWCTSCKKELPILDNMPLDKSKVEIIGVDTDKKVSKGKAFQQKLKLKMRVYNDPTQKIISKFAPFGMPALYYLKGGKVVKIRQGAIPHIDKKINKDLQELR